MRAFFSTILVVAIIAALGYATWSVYFNPLNKVRREVVLTRLHSLPASFWVLETEIDRAEVVHDSGGFLLGRRYGRADIAIRMHWGFNLRELEPSDITVLGRRITATLPEIEVIDVVPDLTTWHYHARRSGLHAIVDFFRSRSIQDDLIATIAAKMSVIPDKEDPERRRRLIARLNEQAKELFGDTDLTVRFR